MHFLQRAWLAVKSLFPRKFQTMFGTAKVYETAWYDDDVVRVLDLSGTLQSATYIDDRWCELPFPYLELYDLAFLARAQTRDVLMLGGGGFAYPKHLIAEYPQARIDVVEIDPAITDVARREFFLDRLISTYDTDAEDRLRIICAEGGEYLDRCRTGGRRYDAIMNDCFKAEEPARGLMTADSARLIKDCLVPDGLYLTNVITAIEGDQAKPLKDMTNALGTAFCHVLAATCDRCVPTEPDNVVVVATDAHIELPGTIRLYDVGQ